MHYVIRRVQRIHLTMAEINLQSVPLNSSRILGAWEEVVVVVGRFPRARVIVPSSSSLIGGYGNVGFGPPLFTCKRHTTLNASIHFATSSEKERRASPLRLRIETIEDHNASVRMDVLGQRTANVTQLCLVFFTSSNRRGYPLSLCLSRVEVVA